MSLQNLLFATGVVSFALGAVLLLLAARLCVREDMRAVFEDLSGKRRQRGIEEALLATARAHAVVHDTLGSGAVLLPAQGNPCHPDAQPAGEAEPTLVATDDDATLVRADQGFLMARRIVLRGTQDVVGGGRHE